MAPTSNIKYQCPMCLWVGTGDQMLDHRQCPTCYVEYGPDWEIVDE